MENPPVLLHVSLALAPLLQGLPHTLDLVNDFLLPEIIDSAVYNGLQRVVLIYGPYRIWTFRAMDGAAARGRLDVVRWLHDHRSEGCSANALVQAAANGHVEVVEWLINNRAETCIPVALSALVAAESAKEVEVASYLRSQIDPQELQTAVEQAAPINDLKVAAALLPGNFDTSLALRRAVANDHARMVELILWNSPVTTDATRAMDFALRNGRLHSARMIMHRGNPFDKIYIFSVAAAIGRVELVDLLLPESDSASIDVALTLALERGYVRIVRFLLARAQSDEAEFCLMKAAINGQREAVTQLQYSIPGRSKVGSHVSERCIRWYCSRYFTRPPFRSQREVEAAGLLLRLDHGSQDLR